MHKRNIFLISLLLALSLAALFTFAPSVTGFRALEWLFMPALLVTILLSGASHSPSEVSGWSSFVVLALIYWGLLLIAWALFAEFRMFRGAFRSLETRPQGLRAEPDTARTRLEDLGRILVQVETGRRRHSLLQNTDALDLTGAPNLVAARALLHHGSERLVLKAMDRFERALAAQVGLKEGARAMQDLRAEAERTLEEPEA